MSYAPSAVVAANYPVIQKPLLGGETKVDFVPEAAILVGTFSITGEDAGSWAANPSVTLPTAGVPLVAMVDTGTGIHGGTEDLVLTVNGTDTGDSVINGTASIGVPAYALDTRKFFRVGRAADVVVTGGAGFKTVSGVTIACDADAKGGVIKVYQLPTAASFNEIRGKMDARVSSKAPNPLAIPEGMVGGEWSKYGRSPVPSFTINAKHFVEADGFGKYAGAAGVIRVRYIMESVHSASMYLTGARFNDELNLPDGESEAQTSINGIYEQQMLFLAPVA